MPKIVPISWKKFEKFLLFIGCEFKRQKGDHRVYWRTNLKRPIILPTYKQLPVFIIRNNLRTLGINHDEYLEILKRI
ncbi:type II toxin-antitoxin system HicA family toxin [Patescibacteria group bacterium]|nr:type II toxin-antitoxin system HicA family toxin [Patescibacteria group bacterium]MBU1885246.1 type II toxin-antitoxin system HicA family toxin [Patescibacteria group bacterium]